MRSLLVQALALLALFVPGSQAAAQAPLPLLPVPRELGPLAPADMARAKAAVERLGLPCPISRTRPLSGPKGSRTLYAEVACGPGRMGYILELRQTGAPEAFTCVEANTPIAGKPPTRPCLLSPAAEALGLLAKAMRDPTCDVAEARGLGHTATTGYFELACKDGRGFIMEAAAPFDPDKPAKAQPCLLYDQGSSNITCELGDPAARLRVVDRLAANVGCTATDRRFAGVSSVDGRYYFEAACSDGRTTYLSGSADGVFGEALACDAAAPRFGVCRFTAAYRAQAEAYAKQVRKAGDACEVTAFQAFPPKPEDQSVELACRDGSGRIARFSPGGQSALVVDCGLAPVVGYKCSLSRRDKANAVLTAELQRVARATTCVVADSGLLGVTAAGTVYMEVTCTDLEPGYVIEFQRTPTPKALQAIGCGLVGRCKLAGNGAR